MESTEKLSPVTKLSPTTEEKYQQMRALIRGFGSVLVAYSGGVDSALVMAIAYRELGDKALACIGVSPSYPTREMRNAVKLAEELGVPYRLGDTEEHLDPNYAANPTNRCYFCKSELHDQGRDGGSPDCRGDCVGACPNAGRRGGRPAGPCRWRDCGHAGQGWRRYVQVAGRPRPIPWRG